MLFENRDVDHIAIAVDDLDAAMAEYSAALGVEWKPVDRLSATDMSLFGPDVAGFGSDIGASIDGLLAVGARPSADRNPEAGQPVLLELVYAPPSTPAFEVWGCPDGRHYVHHVAYLVEDVDAESGRLLALGFKRDWYAVDQEGRIHEAYHQSATGIRIQLVPVPRVDR